MEMTQENSVLAQMGVLARKSEQQLRKNVASLMKAIEPLAEENDRSMKAGVASMSAGIDAWNRRHKSEKKR